MRRSGVRQLLLVLAVCFVSVGGFAQRRTSGSTSTPPTTNTPNVNTAPRPTIPNPTTPPLEPSRPIYLRGKVVMDPVMEISEPIPIQRVCGTTVRREGYTDMRGNFSILIGDQSYFQDASESGVNFSRQRQVTPQQLWNCELRAMLPGYTSSSIALAGVDFGDSGPIGNIVLHKIGGVQGVSVSVTSLKAPDKAKKEYQKALEAYQQKKYADAEKHVAKALEIYPQYATAWDLRGREQQQRNLIEDALKSYQAAIAADDKLVAPYIRMAVLYSMRSDWPTVLRLTDRAIQLDPLSYPDAFLLNGAAQYNLKHFDDAEKSATRAISLDTEHHFPRAELLLGSVLQMRGNFPGAAEHLRNFLKLEPNAPEANSINAFLTQYDRQTAAAKPADPPKSQ